MPHYKTRQLASTVEKVEQKNERVVSVVIDDEGNFHVVTEPRVDDTGRPWMPRGMEQR